MRELWAKAAMPCLPQQVLGNDFEKKIYDSNNSNESSIVPHQVLGHDFSEEKINESNNSNVCTPQKESTAKQFTQLYGT